jgi:hypothetical protein
MVVAVDESNPGQVVGLRVQIGRLTPPGCYPFEALASSGDLTDHSAITLVIE